MHGQNYWTFGDVPPNFYSNKSSWMYYFNTWKSYFYKKTISLTVISSIKFLTIFQIEFIAHDGFITKILYKVCLKLVYKHSTNFLIMLIGTEKIPNPSVSTIRI